MDCLRKVDAEILRCYGLLLDMLEVDFKRIRSGADCIYILSLWLGLALCQDFCVDRCPNNCMCEGNVTDDQYV